MANWTKNQPNGGSTRRKWDLEDRASLNNLKYHIAAEGCSDVQYDLARQLLDKTIEQNKESSNQQAVHWLCCAAQQGHEAAAKLLRQCFEDGCGITAENESEVRCCLSMTPGERAARKAARELFACLANGGEHITPKQLERKMREIYNLQKKRRRHGDSTSTSEDETEAEPLENRRALGNGRVHLKKQHRRLRNGDVNAPPQVLEAGPNAGRVITEENLVSAAINYTAGRLPAVNDALTCRVSVPHPATLDHVPCFHRLLFHPVLFLTILYHRLINLVSSFDIPPNVRFAVTIFIYWLACSENLTIFIPIGFYYLCLSVMIWSTCRMLKVKQDFIDFRIWSGLFLSYGDHNFEADISENRFLKNNMKPYLYFFGAFIGNMIVYPFIASEWLPYSELTILSCMFVFVTLFAFMYSSAHRFPDWIVLISFGVNVLARYPYEMDEVVTNSWRFLDLRVPTFCSFVIGNGIEFCLNCRTALYLLIPGFLVHLAKRSRWHGTYTHLVPHCVTLSWLSLCISSSQSCTMFGMVRATLGLAGVLLFLPLFGIVSLMIPVFVAIEWLGFTNPGIRLGSTVVAGVLALLASCFLAVNRTTQKYITALQVVVCIIAACILTFPYMTSNFKDTSRYGNIISNSKLAPSAIPSDPNAHRLLLEPEDEHHHIDWQRFYMLCGQPTWENNNKIKTQLRCSHLHGIAVSWEGTVSQVQITRASNSPEEYISKYLPSWLGNLLRCVYGDLVHSQPNCDASTDPLCSDLQRMLKKMHMGSKCSLHKWNSYEYEILVKMPVSGILSKNANVVLLAGNVFGNFTHKLAIGDRVHFYGTLLNIHYLPNGNREDFVLGSTHTYVNVLAIECAHCQDKDVPAVSLERFQTSPVTARTRDLMRGIKYLLNVLLNPLITFK